MIEKSNRNTQVAIALLGGIFLIAAAIISSPHWFKFFFPEQYIEQEAVPTKKTKNNSQENSTKELGIENLIINKIELCPVSSKLPSYLLVEIKNNGSKKLRNINLTINLGRASFNGIEILGNNVKNVDTTKVNELIVTFSELIENDSKTIYCLLSQPIFNSIKINGENLKFSKEYTYKDFIENDSIKSSNLNGFFIFLQIVIGFILSIFSLYFVTIVYKLLKKKNIIDWG